MTGQELGRAYLAKARLRLEVLQLLAARQGWSDLVREAQELVELACKSMLRQLGIDPPRIHDVGPVLMAEQHRFPLSIREQIPGLADQSQWLRAQHYGPEDGARALAAAETALQVAEMLISGN